MKDLIGLGTFVVVCGTAGTFPLAPLGLSMCIAFSGSYYSQYDGSTMVLAQVQYSYSTVLYRWSTARLQIEDLI